eukprot:2523778-Amphidinium_carterae.1
MMTKPRLLRESWTLTTLAPLTTPNCNGYLDRHELLYALTNHGIIQQSEIDGGIHHKEPFSPTRMMTTSSEVSADDFGAEIEDMLSLNELLGDGITLEELLDELDTSGDGRISYEEFQAYFKRKR